MKTIKFLPFCVSIFSVLFTTFYFAEFKAMGVDQTGSDLSAAMVWTGKSVESKAKSPYEATFEGLYSWGSQAHCYGIFPACFLSSYVLGVRLDGPVQRKSLLIEPHLGDLTETSGTVVTEFSPMPVSWEKIGEHWNFSAEIPAGIKTHLRLPVGMGKSTETLDSNNMTSIRKGRSLEIPLNGDLHGGTWNNPN